MNRLRATIALAPVLVVAACATYSDRTQAMRDAVGQADYDGGLHQLNALLKVNSSEQLPTKWKKNFELVVLERATVLQAKRDYDLSARDFQVVDKELELLDIARDGAGQIGKYIFSDSAPKYKSPPTEKLALNAMNLCNYLVRGDLDGAKVEARRFTVMRDYFRDYDPEHEHGAFGSYLAGFTFEYDGNAEEALRYYDEALQEREFSSLRAVVPRLAARSSFRGKRIGEYISEGGAPNGLTDPFGSGSATPSGEGSAGANVADEGELLVVAKIGRVPYKVPVRLPIGAAIGLAGAYVTGNTKLLEYGMFKVVVYPELVGADDLFDVATLTVAGTAVKLDLATDLAREITAEYEELKPKIIGAALTRMIARAAAAEGARAAGRQAEGAAGLVGFLAAAAVEGSMVALDKPDTRSWTTLPARVYVGRTRLPAGKHQIVVKASGPGGHELHTQEVEVRPGRFVVVDVTTLR